MLLRPATVEDLRTVLTWINSPEQLKFWGGERLTWPPRAKLTWQQIEANTHKTFALIDDKGEVAGFAQTLIREENAVHLGRIILSPALRGQGVGRVLMEKLIEKGKELYHPKYFSLYVYSDNVPAVKLYRSMGFVVTESYEEDFSCRMELKEE